MRSSNEDGKEGMLSEGRIARKPFTHSGFRASSAINVSHGFMVRMCCRSLGVQLPMCLREPSACDLDSNIMAGASVAILDHEMTLRLEIKKDEAESQEEPLDFVEPPNQLKTNDYHFEYTECDGSGSRWRVAIPNSAADCSGLPDPEGDGYSGPSVPLKKHRDSHIALPDGLCEDPFTGKDVTAFSCASGEYLEMKNQVCSKCGEGTYSLGSGIKFDEWDELPAGFSNIATFMDTVVGPSDSRPDGCNNSSWVPRGNYIESNRDDCTVSLIYAVHLKKSGYVFFEYQYVDNNIFFEFFVMLKSGTNILYWRTTGILMGSKAVKPVLTQIMYKWIEPKICREDLTDAIRLPPSGEKKDCPPCNPGFYNNGSSSCHPCPPGTFSDGTKECRPCPAGMEPALGFEYKWWNVLPGNMKTSCFNVGNSKCDGMNGWEVAGDHIQSGAGGSDNDYLILNLHIPGFKPPTSMTGAMGSELGRITFVFETLCSADCVLYFMVDINRKSTNVVESWGGTKEKQAYTHIIFKNATFTFTWAFQRTNQGQDNRRFINDMVKIYSITATNAVDGVASSCRACALGSEQSGSSCVPCPPGHYIEKETNQCKECPPDTYLSIHQVYGKEACIPCGPGSRSTQDHSVCYSDCFFHHEKENQSLHYDFSNLSSVGSLMNGPSFTSKGTKYFHFFNISLCGHEGKKMALCTNNITDFTVKEMVAGSDDYTNLVGAYVCQSTIIPSESKGFRAALSSQSIILADRFLGVTIETTLQNINIKEEMFPVTPSQIPDVFYNYNILCQWPVNCCENEVQSYQTRSRSDFSPQAYSEELWGPKLSRWLKLYFSILSFDCGAKRRDIRYHCEDRSPIK
ncbi:hypothetical protein GH733_013239, partial [Mirounga leonina]